MSERAREVAREYQGPEPTFSRDCERCKWERDIDSLAELLREYAAERVAARIAEHESVVVEPLRAKLREVEERLAAQERVVEAARKVKDERASTGSVMELVIAVDALDRTTTVKIDSRLDAMERVMEAGRDWKAERYRLHKDGSPSYESQKAAALAVAIDEYDRTTAGEKETSND